MPRISHRRYPERVCINPACKLVFVPHDKRQIYCETQCQINAGNDRRHHANNTRFADEKTARINNKILERIWLRLAGKRQKLVTKEILDYERFVFDSQTLFKKNNTTKQSMLWFYDYGLEMIDLKGL